MTATSTTPNATVVGDEERADVTTGDSGAWRHLVGRLNRQSTDKHFDAYADVAWDDPEMAIDIHDPRWEITDDDPLGRTEWYRSQPQEVRAEIGLMRIASNMKVGLQFESILQRGLLEYAAKLPDGSPEFRYAYHEVIEEGHHSMMFQEFVNRAGLPVPGMDLPTQIGARRVVQMGRRFPEMFFVFVLGGEDPIDHVQRETLRSGRELHPLLQHIMRIHVTEEARHLSFARHYLKRQVPRLNPIKRFAVSIQAPVTLGVMAGLMLQPPSHLIKRYGIPKHVIKEAYGTAEARATAARSLRKVRNLCVELGLVTWFTKPIWKALHIWGED
ncbi:MAG: diiron oxygenase [Actinobacteria bacterium]|nr:diiron oxygenase [Actinomycetota bacterium]